MSDFSTIGVALGGRSYDILVGDGLIDRAGALALPFMKRRRTVVVADETVARLHGARLGASLERAGIAHGSIAVPPGEANKTLETFAWLVDKLLDTNPERSDAIVALGGGVVGDLAGFAASVLKRGIDFVQIPTTLLAQVDSSVGGKTGVDTRHGKNLVGAFHQPRLVIADTALLDTLPRRELLAGYAEVAKYGLLGDAAFFEWLEAKGAEALASAGPARRYAVEVSCRMKAAIVARDERETGDRALLNLGHTFAHAIETALGFGDALRHGEAVAVGLCLALALSRRLGLCSGQEVERARRHFAGVGLPTRLANVKDLRAEPERLYELMGQDKKVKDGRPTFILLRGIGAAFQTNDVAKADVLAVLAEG